MTFPLPPNLLPQHRPPLSSSSPPQFDRSHPKFQAPLGESILNFLSLSRILQSMASEVVLVGELPLLRPIKTAPVREKPIEAQAEAATSASAGDSANGCVTPKSEEHLLKPVTVCPPAPRKPKPARRAAPRHPVNEFRAVPRDLTAVFLPLPPKKRIRVA